MEEENIWVVPGYWMEEEEKKGKRYLKILKELDPDKKHMIIYSWKDEIDPYRVKIVDMTFEELKKELRIPEMD